MIAIGLKGSLNQMGYLPSLSFHIITTKKKLINDTFNASSKSYNDAFSF